MPKTEIIPLGLNGLSLNSNGMTVEHQVEIEVQSEKLSTLRNGFLKAWFTVPANIAMPTARDVCGVHIASLQAENVLAEKTGMDGLRAEHLYEIAEELAQSLPVSTFRVTISSNITEPSKINHVITENARTMLEAISQAMTYTIEEIYDDLPSGHYDDPIKTILKNRLLEDELLAINFKDGNSYTVTGITEHPLCRSNMPRYTVPKDTGLVYVDADSKMITDLDRTLNIIPSRTNNLLAGLHQEVVSDLNYCKLSVGFTMDKPIGKEQLLISDIKQVYLFNYANVIVAQSDELSNLSTKELNTLVHGLIHGAKDYGWNIEVITVRKGITSRSVVKRNGTHILEAIESGILFLADMVYDDFGSIYDENIAYSKKLEWIKNTIKRQASTGQPIVVKIGYATHTVKSVRQRDVVDYETENNLI